MENYLQVAAAAEGMVLAFFLLILIVLFFPAAGRVFARWAVLRGRGVVIERCREDLSIIARLFQKAGPYRSPRAGIGRFSPAFSGVPCQRRRRSVFPLEETGI